MFSSQIQDRKSYWEKRYSKQGKRTVGNNCLSEDEFLNSTMQIESFMFNTFKDCFGYKRVLDFGCGYGRISKMLIKFCSELYGIDLASWPIEQAKKLVSAGNFQTYDGQKLPFKDRFFGGFITWTVLQHIHPDLIFLICKELDRITDIGSKIILYENTTLWIEDSDYTWYRSSDDYKKLFPNYSEISKGDIDWFDGSSKEIHTLLVMQKVK
jgi:ubiquinone/menaquinone biosynthesis C-methylase UbiE